MRFNLAANGAESKETQGNFVYVENATGKVTVTALMESGKSSSIKLRAGDQARFDVPFTALRVQDNSGAANTVDIETGFAQYIPRQDGGPVQITGQTAPLDVSGATVTVEYAVPQQVTVNGGVDAVINDPVEVLTDPLNPLDVKPVQVEPGAAPLDVSAATVTVQQAFVVDTEEQIAGTLTPGAELTLNVAGNIAANLNRVDLHIKAPLANVGVVWLSGAAGSGISLDPGEKITLVTTAAVSLIAASAGDKIQFMETVR